MKIAVFDDRGKNVRFPEFPGDVEGPAFAVPFDRAELFAVQIDVRFVREGFPVQIETAGARGLLRKRKGLPVESDLAELVARFRPHGGNFDPAP